MRIHDVACKSAVYYSHHEGTWFIAKRLHEENNRALLISLMWHVEFRMCIAIYYHIHDKSGKFEWILYQVLKNIKSLYKIKGTVKHF
jgi:hypothetical protein